MAAARVVFERDGFHNARLSDIVVEAGVAIGTFYNYYPSKEEVFRDLMQTVIRDFVEGVEVHHDPAHADPVEGIEAANRAYVRGYLRNARLMSLLLQVGEQDPELRRLGLEMRGGFERRVSHAIARWQKEGLAWPDLDPVYAANALGYMVDRFLYEWALLDLDYDEDKVVYTVTRLWVRALGLERPYPPTPASPPGSRTKRPRRAH